MTTQITTCRIWGDDYTAIGYSNPDPSEAVVEKSDRTSGGYVTLGSVRQALLSLDDGERARLTTWLIDQRLQGNSLPTVTKEIIEYAVNRSRLPIYERADRLLRFMSEQTAIAGQLIDLARKSPKPDIPTNPIFLGAMAWSESTSPDEVSYLIGHLEEEGWVLQSRFTMRPGHTVPTGRHRVTVRGHARVAEQVSSVDSSQAFVAMWFDESVAEAYDEGIEPAILDCGYEPKRIDRDPTVDKIDDAIIAEIRRSRFIIADFTHGKKGPRGGVYYEAGFAHGLGIPVIFTCRKDIIDEVHFDTRQYAHILWDSASGLRSSLRDRIIARIGEGPRIMA